MSSVQGNPSFEIGELGRVLSDLGITPKGTNARRKKGTFKGFRKSYGKFIVAKLDAAIKEKENMLRRLEENEFDADYLDCFDPIGWLQCCRLNL